MLCFFVMAKHDFDNESTKQESKNAGIRNNLIDEGMLPDSFAAGKSQTKQKSDKSFSEIVQESTRLPDIKSSLPISMKEILHTTPKSTDWAPRLPTLQPGQVQLVHRSETKTNRKEKQRRLKRERKTKVQGQRKHESLFSHRLDTEHEHNEVSWKKKLHQRQKKRILDEGEGSLTVNREFRLPTLGHVTKW